MRQIEGNRPEGWVMTTLSEEALINPRESIKKGEIKVNVPMACIDSFTKKINLFERKKFKGGTKFRNGDTLLARITPCLENGKTAFVDILEENEVGFGSTEYIVIREKENHSDKQFLFYLSISPFFREVAIRAMTGTSGRQRVQTDVLINKALAFPPLPEQKAIAKVLTAFDDKIENLRAQNKTLEQTAQTIFKEWFGNYQIDDELPEGWRFGKLGDIAFNHSKSFKFSEENVVFINTGDVLKGQFLHENEISPLNLPGQAKKAIELHDILYSEIRPKNKRFAFVDFDTSNYVVSTKFMIIRPKGSFNAHILYLILKSQSAIDEFNITAESRSGTFPQITFDSISDYPVVIPTEKSQNKFERILKPLMEKERINNQQIQSLTQTRDTVLPKLMSGELRVNEFKN